MVYLGNFTKIVEAICHQMSGERVIRKGKQECIISAILQEQTKTAKNFSMVVLQLKVHTYEYTSATLQLVLNLFGMKEVASTFIKTHYI
jgi:hypothetical protein